MAGHSKWANIQHRKGRQDAKRGKLFTRLIREITVAARLGGADASGNPRLRAAVDNALSNNMPKDTVDRAIKRGAGDGDASNLEELVYEGYGNGGVALIINCMTDNRKRTVAEVRHVLSKHGGNLGTDGCVAHLFDKLGLLSFPNTMDEERLMEQALEAGAEDITGDPAQGFEVLTPPDKLFEVKERLEGSGMAPEQAELTMRSNVSATLDLEGALSLVKLVDALEDLDDVQQVWSNADIPDEVAAQLDSD